MNKEKEVEAYLKGVLPEEQKLKYEIAQELGILDKVLESGWKSLSAKETGRINLRLILPMMPMPKHIDGDAVGAAITMSKDVDCLNPKSVGEVFLGRSRWAPCTPRACMATLSHYGIELKGKNVVVVGRSNVVGKPVALLLLQEHATVTVCHSRTRDIADVLRGADVIVAAVGVPAFIKPEMVKEGVVIVDVGINAVEGGLVGDVDPAVSAKASAFTPVPGGIGIVSNMMVMDMLSRNL